jgi:c(7)-type cytochrome triheme protein
MIRFNQTMRLLAAVLGLGLATAAAADGLKKLPPDYAFPKSKDSIGRVTFRHSSHVDTSKPSCVICHPRIFRTLEAGRTAGGEPIVHAAMEQGKHCGACHGKAAFGFDNCAACHEQ